MLLLGRRRAAGTLTYNGKVGGGGCNAGGVKEASRGTLTCNGKLGGGHNAVAVLLYKAAGKL